MVFISYYPKSFHGLSGTLPASLRTFYCLFCCGCTGLLAVPQCVTHTSTLSLTSCSLCPEWSSLPNMAHSLNWPWILSSNVALSVEPSVAIVCHIFPSSSCADNPHYFSSEFTSSLIYYVYLLMVNPPKNHKSRERWDSLLSSWLNIGAQLAFIGRVGLWVNLRKEIHVEECGLFLYL